MLFIDWPFRAQGCVMAPLVDLMLKCIGLSSLDSFSTTCKHINIWTPLTNSHIYTGMNRAKCRGVFFLFNDTQNIGLLHLCWHWLQPRHNNLQVTSHKMLLSEGLTGLTWILMFHSPNVLRCGFTTDQDKAAQVLSQMDLLYWHVYVCERRISSLCVCTVCKIVQRESLFFGNILCFCLVAVTPSHSHLSEKYCFANHPILPFLLFGRAG